MRQRHKVTFGQLQSCQGKMTTLCSQHRFNVSHYCQDCSKVICSACLASGGHKDHWFFSLNDTFTTEEAKMHQLLQQAKETSLGIQQLLQNIEDKDCRLENSYEETREYIASSFLAIQQAVNAREKALLKEVDTTEAELINRLGVYFDTTPEQDCLQQWVDYAFNLTVQLKQRDVSATLAYEECMSGLQNALAKVVTQNDQVANELQGQPASIKFTSNSTAEIERAIKSFGKFEEVSDQGSSEQPVYSNVQHGSAQSNTLPCLLPPPTLPPPPPPVAKRRPNIAVFAGCTLRSYYDVPDTQNEYDQPSKMMTPSLDQTVYIQLPAMHQKRSHETPYDIPTCDLPTDRLDLPCPLPNDICKQQQRPMYESDSAHCHASCRQQRSIPQLDSNAATR